MYLALAMVNKTADGEVTRKPGRVKRFCQRMCMPLHRALTSYLETTPYTGAEDDTESAHDETADYQDDVTVNYDQPMSLNYAESINRHSRSRYRAAPPVHPSSRSLSCRASSFNYMLGFIASIRNSLDVDDDIRGETQSPEYDAPRVNGRKPIRLRTEKNKDLPGSLRAQPAQMSRANLADIDSGKSNTRLVEQIPKASFSSRQAARYPWVSKNDCSQRSNGESSGRSPGSQPRFRSRRSRRESSKDTSRSQPLPQSQSRHCTARPPHSSGITDDTPHTSSPSLTCCTTAGILRMNEAEQRSGVKPTRIIPLRDDPDHVLWKSHSRGFMILRRILSLEALRESADMRTPASLVGVMEELHAKTEMYGEWSGAVSMVNDS
jgi:hypothetical protein